MSQEWTALAKMVFRLKPLQRDNPPKDQTRLACYRAVQTKVSVCIKNLSWPTVLASEKCFDRLAHTLTACSEGHTLIFADVHFALQLPTTGSNVSGNHRGFKKSYVSVVLACCCHVGGIVPVDRDQRAQLLLVGFQVCHHGCDCCQHHSVGVYCLWGV